MIPPSSTLHPTSPVVVIIIIADNIDHSTNFEVSKEVYSSSLRVKALIKEN
jgi:hypothetical protein